MRTPQRPRLVVLSCVAACVVLVGACDDNNEPGSPTDTGGLAPAGTDSGVAGGDDDDPVDDDITGSSGPGDSSTD